jgi:hypothetical protein
MVHAPVENVSTNTRLTTLFERKRKPSWVRRTSSWKAFLESKLIYVVVVMIPFIALPQFVSIVPGQFELGTVVFQRYIGIWVRNLVRSKFTLPCTYTIHAVIVVVIVFVAMTPSASLAEDERARLLVRFLLQSPAPPSPPASLLPSPLPFLFLRSSRATVTQLSWARRLDRPVLVVPSCALEPCCQFSVASS